MNNTDIPECLRFDEEGKWLGIIGYVCPSCRAVVKQSGFGYHCIDSKCRLYGYPYPPMTIVHRFEEE